MVTGAYTFSDIEEGRPCNRAVQRSHLAVDGEGLPGCTSEFPGLPTTFYVGHHHGEAHIASMTPVSVYVADTERPPRFHGYRVILYAHGMSYVPAPLTNYQKYLEGCDPSPSTLPTEK